MQSDVKIVTVPVRDIEDKERFHTTFARVFGFPDGSGGNLTAWIASIICLEHRRTGEVAVAKGGFVAMRRDARSRDHRVRLRR